MARAQVPLAAIEAGIGILLLLSLAMAFAMGVPAADARGAQLDAYAHDAATILQNEQPRHGGQTRLSELGRSAAAFDRERSALRRRADRLLPDNVLYRIETRHGTVGHPLPDDVPTGVARVTTGPGPVTIRVWYV